MGIFNIQTSLACHGGCAVCYVAAPLKKENVELDYDKAYDFFEKIRPSTILFEGGEVPIQKNAMLFVERVKNFLGPKSLHLLTNGCYSVQRARDLAGMFDDFTVSYMGFSKNVYYHETGLDVDKTKTFCKEVHSAKGKIAFRYICTPITMIEAYDFVQFASSFSDSYAIFADCDINLYAKEPEDIPYWSLVIKRCRVMFKEQLLLSRDVMKDNNFTVKLEPRTADLLGINKQFVDKFKLDHVVFY